MPKSHEHAYLPVFLCLIVSAWCFSAQAGPTVPPKLVERPNELAAQNALKLILAELAGQREDLIAIQRELVRFPGINPEDGGDGEEAKARWIEKWLAAEGLPPAERVDCPDERVPAKIRPNLILRYPHEAMDDPRRPTLWLVAYLDNSQPGDEKAWTHFPLTLRVDGDLMYGLAVQDNNDAIAAVLLLLRSLHRHQNVPPMNLGVLMVSGERSNGTVGLLHIMKLRPQLLRTEDPVFCFFYGEGDGDRIGVAEKGLLWLNVAIHGKQVHSSIPHAGNNAFAAAAELVTLLPKLSERFPAANPLFDPPTSTFAPTKPEAKDTMPNQIPGYFSFVLDARILPGYTQDEVQAAVEELAAPVARKYGVDIRTERRMVMTSSPITPADTPIVLALSRAIDKQLARPARLYGIGGVSPAAMLRRQGIMAAVWQMAPPQGHSTDESMSIRANLTEAAMVARVLFDPELAAACAPAAAPKAP